MIHLIYASSATSLLAEQDLIELLQKAREKNHRLGITGMLLYKGGNFLQVLEGNEDAVMPLYEVIQEDPRHHHVMTIAKRNVKERMFPEWQMAFVNLQSIDPDDIPGYSQFLNEKFTPEYFTENPSLAQRFLQVFKENMR
jgi:hypothetical protein